MISLGKETLQIIENRQYGEKSLELELRYLLKCSKTYLPNEPLSGNYAPSPSKAKIIVTCKSTLESAREMKDKIGECARVGVLNFASAIKPGGGFLNDRKAQEESLARSSTLYASLRQEKTFYETHLEAKTPLYTDAIIYSPNVSVFRNDEGAFLPEPYVIDVVSAAAPNYHEAKTKLKNVDREHVAAIYLKRARRVLQIFAENEIRHIVLGAWGTGVFRNEIDDVIAAWSTLVAEFSDTFTIIEFAILDVNTCKRFAEALTSTNIDEKSVEWIETQRRVNGYDFFNEIGSEK